MNSDPVIDEIRHFRDGYAERFQFDLTAICNDLREQQRRSGRVGVILTPKPVDEEAEQVASLDRPLIAADRADAFRANPILDELHRHREAYAEQFDFDLKAIVQDLKDRQNDGGQSVVDFARERPGDPQNDAAAMLQE